MHKHPEDRRAQQRRWYQEHKEEVLARTNAYYHAHKSDPAFKQRRRIYMRNYRFRKRFGR